MREKNTTDWLADKPNEPSDVLDSTHRHSIRGTNLQDIFLELITRFWRLFARGRTMVEHRALNEWPAQVLAQSSSIPSAHMHALHMSMHA